MILSRIRLYAIIAALAIMLVLLFGRSVTIRKELRRALSANRNQKEMRDAAAKVRTDRDSLIDRLRKGGF